MRALVLACAAAIGLVPNAAQATNWVLVAGNSRSYDFLDSDTVQVVGPNRVRGWIKKEFRTNPPLEGRVPIHNDRQQWEWNCADRTSDLLAYAAYSAEGIPLRTGVIAAYDRRAEPIVPGTVGESLMKAACRQGGFPIP